MAQGNVTIDPLSPALPVENPEIREVLDLMTGVYWSAPELIRGLRYDQLIELRGNVRSALNSAPLYKCALCHTAVYIVASPEKRFFFRHQHEDGSCPARSRGALSQDEIRARKYHGLKESEPHKRIKRLLERSLLADPTFAPGSIRQEKRLYVSEDRGQWRQPDIQAARGGQQFAFEAQLSTTFLDVVVGRRDDYRAGGIQLIWIMAGFDPDYRRLTTDDIIFSNNSNLFVVDDETCLLSEAKQELHLRCSYREPYLENGQMKDRWIERVVAFSELTLEPDRQRAYFFDFAKTEESLKSSADADLRDEFFAIWKENMAASGEVNDLQRWSRLRGKLATCGIAVPARPDGNTGFATMVNGILSASGGAPVGWHFRKLVEVAHHIHERYPQHILAFGYAIGIAGHQRVISEQDTQGRWRSKSAKLKERLRQRDAAFMPDPEWLPALCFLFPEVGLRVTQFLAKTGPDNNSRAGQSAGGRSWDATL